MKESGKRTLLFSSRSLYNVIEDENSLSLFFLPHQSCCIPLAILITGNCLVGTRVNCFSYAFRLVIFLFFFTFSSKISFSSLYHDVELAWTSALFLVSENFWRFSFSFFGEWTSFLDAWRCFFLTDFCTFPVSEIFWKVVFFFRKNYVIVLYSCIV